MPFRRSDPTFIVIPANAGPGQARIVITSTLPPPLNTYTFIDRAGVGTTYSGAIIFYPYTQFPPFDLNYTYLAVTRDPGGTGSTSDVHMGDVHGGVVKEISAGVPAVQLWENEGSSVGTQRWISGGLVGIESFSSTGQLILRALNGANATLTGGNTLSVTLVGTLLSILSTAAGGDIAVTATDQLTLTATDINLAATSQVEVKGTRAYLTTQLQTNRCNAAMAPVPAVFTNVANCLITLPTVTTNAFYECTIVINTGMNPPANDIVVGRLLVNGVAQVQTVVVFRAGAQIQRDTEGQTFSGTLAAAGNHTFQLQAGSIFASAGSDIAANDSTITVKISESGG